MPQAVSSPQEATGADDRLSLRDAARELGVGPSAMSYLVVGAGLKTQGARYSSAKTIARADIDLLRDRLARRDAS